MKTLDEVIKAFECCDHGEPDSNCKECSYDFLGACCRVREEDALTYLRGYREVLPEYAQMKADAALNTPLTWDELKDMVGKPVWVEYNLDSKFDMVRNDSKNWGIIGNIQKVYYNRADHNWLRIAIWTDETLIFTEEGLGKTWQAYRKERK